MKHNKDMWHRYSTWQNIAEAVGLVLVQFLTTMPEEMSNALWLALALRILMAGLQGIKQSVPNKA